MKLHHLFPALFLCLALGHQAEARPVAVTLYPGGALVTEEEAVVPANGTVSLCIPAGAEERSLNISLSSGCIVSRSTVLLHGTASPAATALQKKKNALRADMDRKRAELEGLAAMRQFWVQPPYSISAPSVEMANSLMDIFSKESEGKLGRLAQQETRLRSELHAMESRAAALEASLGKLGKENLSVRECTLTLRNAGDGPLKARYSYWLPNARWEPQYRISADSATGRVLLRMDAAISQNSGMDWNGIELTLASTDSLHKIDPPALRQWVLDQNRNDGLMLKAVRAMAAPESAPTAVQDAAGLTWALGRVDVPASATVTRLAALHHMDAEFSRLARPRQSRDVWMYAALSPDSLAKAPVLPAGQASFLVDGRETARGTFRFGPASRDIFLGVDQLMAVAVNELAASPDSVTQDTSPDFSTRRWSWRAELTSAHDRAVAVRVEEAAPITRDAAARIAVQTSPEARFEPDHARYVWKLDIPARGKAEVRCEVKASFPTDKD